MHILKQKVYIMITNQIMKRNFNNSVIEQRTKDGFFNATMLLNLSNSNSIEKKRFKDFWENKGTKTFMEELSNSLNGRNCAHLINILPTDLYETKKGRGGCTWMHPYLFVKFAMWLSPKFEVQVIKWVYDNLIDFRNQAGDYYKELCSSIMQRYSQYYNGKSASPLIFANEAKFLNSLVIGEFRGIERNTLEEKELDLLNNLQKLDIDLIERGFGKIHRHEKLRDYAYMYKVANFNN